MSQFETLAQSTYVSLTTFKRDGTPVATPVWVVGDGDRLYVTTPLETGKVKRLRHTSRVLLAPCDVRGNLKGPQVDGEARLLDADGSDRVLRLIDSKYGLVSKVLGFVDVVVRNRGRKPERVGIEISLADA